MQQARSQSQRLGSIILWQSNIFEKTWQIKGPLLEGYIRKAIARRASFLIHYYTYIHRGVMFIVAVVYKYFQRGRLERWLAKSLRQKKGVIAPPMSRYFLLKNLNLARYKPILYRRTAFETYVPKMKRQNKRNFLNARRNRFNNKFNKGNKVWPKKQAKSQQFWYNKIHKKWNKNIKNYRSGPQKPTFLNNNKLVLSKEVIPKRKKKRFTKKRKKLALKRKYKKATLLVKQKKEDNFKRKNRIIQRLRGWIDLEYKIFFYFKNWSHISTSRLLNKSLSLLGGITELRVHNIIDFIETVNPNAAIRHYILRRYQRVIFSQDVVSGLYLAIQLSLSSLLAHTIILGLERNARRRRQRSFMYMVKSIIIHMAKWNTFQKRIIWRISVFGKIDAKIRRRHYKLRLGFVRHQSIEYVLNYSQQIARTKFGSTSVRIWLRHTI